MNRLRTILLIFLFLITSMTAAAQPIKQCEIKELLNRNGWRIPGLQRAKQIETPHRYKTDEGEDLVLEIFKPISPADSVVLASGVADSIGRLEIREQPVDNTGNPSTKTNSSGSTYTLTVSPTHPKVKEEK